MQRVCGFRPTSMVGLVISGGNDMQKSEKEQVVAELTERLRTADTLIVADYRGLTNAQIDGLRTKVLESGARFSVVKNTLTRRAAEAAGADALLALLTGPTAIAFVESDGDPVAVAKALGDAARDTKVLAIRGGILQGRELSADEVESLAKLPPLETLRGQVIGAILAPLNAFAGLVNAPLQNLVGLIDARVEQLGSSADAEQPIGEGPIEGDTKAETEAAAETEGTDVEPTDIAQPQAEREET
jgi:large subunit ribosomal protein L10